MIEPSSASSDLTFPEIEINFRYTEADFLEFLKDYFLRNRSQLYVILGASALIVLAFTNRSNLFSVQYLLSVLLPIGMIAALWFWMLQYSGRRSFRMTPQMQEARSCTIGNEHIQMTGETFSSRFEWSGVQQVVETKHLFLLYSSPANALILPKRAFSEAERAGFVERVNRMSNLKVKWRRT